MSPYLPEHALVTLLRQCYTKPSCLRPRGSLTCSTRALHTTTRPTLRPRHRQSLQHGGRSQRTIASAEDQRELRSECRGSATRNSGTGIEGTQSLSYASHGSGGGHEQSETRIAIIGGGVTGLTAAHYLTKEIPNARVTIYEAGARLGGWLESEKVEVEGGTVIFEKGPRTLRPHTDAALVTLDMIQDLDLQDEMLIGWKTSAAARNRFVYYPDHLVKMPGPGQRISDILWRVLTEPIFTGIFDALFEHRKPKRPSNLEDESVASFLARRTGSKHIADNIVSAVFHGIYAGDIEQMSAKSILPNQWFMEAQHGSLTSAMLAANQGKFLWNTAANERLKKELMPKVQGLYADLQDASVFAFKEGIGCLATALESSLRKNPKVSFRTKDKITSLDYDLESNGVKITSTTSATYSKVISTIPGSTLSTLSSNRLPSLAQTPCVTVMVVNLWYPTPNLLPEEGFGYLIPRSIPFEQNPECALGVVFDSDAISNQDTAPGTKLTVMMGGHWWDSFSASDYPDETEGMKMAYQVVRRHLGIDEVPVAWMASLRKNCIPQYTVGHTKRMQKGHQELLDVFKGKLSVAGSSYNGVGMNDCVRGARDVVIGIRDGIQGTGLGAYMVKDERKYVKVYLGARK